MEYLFSNLSVNIRKIVKKKILTYFQKEDFKALTLMVNIGLLDFFTIEEYITLIKGSEYKIIQILVLGLSFPYWQLQTVIYPRVRIFDIFKKVENYDENINKKLKDEIFRLFKEGSKWILVELIMDQFFKYLEKDHIENLFQEPNSALKTNFNEILTTENKSKEFDFGDYIERVAGFLTKISKELGLEFLLDFIHNLPNESKIMLEKDLKEWIDLPDASLDDLIQVVSNDDV